MTAEEDQQVATESREVSILEALEADWLQLEEYDWNWVALYGDGAALTQYGPDGERSFGDIDQDRLMAFFVTNGTNMVGVDMVIGEFMVNDMKFRVPGWGADPANPYRLIYFRRHTQEFSLAGGDDGAHTVMHCVGWRRASGDGTTEKRILGAAMEWDEAVEQDVMVLVSVEE